MSEEKSSLNTGMEILEARVCIVGGGPAGLMLGLLLARQNVKVLVLEKHKDFLRDFRGDTIHPSTLELMFELGKLDEFLKRPHQEFTELFGQVGSERVAIGDFSHLPTHCKFIALMPQWDFLNFVCEIAEKLPAFRLIREAEVTELIQEGGKVTGVKATTPKGPMEVKAGLVVGADGRHSIVRARANLPVEDLGSPMDVLWVRVTRSESDPTETFGHVDTGRILVLLNREAYWQCAFVIPKGSAEQLKQKGLENFQNELLHLAPFLKERVREIDDWKQVSLLTVTVDRLKKWSKPGLLCIGDAAHAMSPVGGVGINLAIQDAVATSNLLGPILKERMPSEDELRLVQKRREFPTKVTQAIQIFVQNKIIGAVLHSDKLLKPAWPLKLLNRFPILRRIPARIVGYGIRPEHIRTGKPV